MVDMHIGHSNTGNADHIGITGKRVALCGERIVPDMYFKANASKLYRGMITCPECFKLFCEHMKGE